MHFRKNLKLLFGISLFTSVSMALPLYVQSTYLDNFISVEYVGVYFMIAMAVTMVFMNMYPWLIKTFSNYQVALITLALYTISLMALIEARTAVWVLPFFVLLTVTQNLFMVNLDLFVERLTDNNVTGRVRTIYYTFVNFGVLLAPAFAGLVVNEEQYEVVFFSALLMVVPVLLTLLWGRKRFSDHLQYKHQHFGKTLKHVWRTNSLRYIFGIEFLLQLFYGMAIIYLPIYLHEVIGFPWLVLGPMFGLALVPFVLLEIPAGFAADKRWGERGLFAIGFVVLALAVILFAFVRSTDPIVWTIILVLSRCGAALIEAMRETYFFKVVDVEDIDYINFFRNNRPLGYLVAAGVGIVVLQVLPLQYLFVILGLVLLFGLYFTMQLDPIKPPSADGDRPVVKMKY